eukprot:3289604-Lingulodinium_polyedra.AAC.1
MPESDWQALLAIELKDDDHSVAQPDISGCCHTCYVWSVAAMASFAEARESAREAKKTLFYRQAVDVL